MEVADLLLLFPGQGSRVIGMGHHLWEDYPGSKDMFEEASDMLGWDVAGLCREGPIEELTRTDKAQPALFVCSVATWGVLREDGAGAVVPVLGLEGAAVDGICERAGPFLPAFPHRPPPRVHDFQGFCKAYLTRSHQSRVLPQGMPQRGSATNPILP